MTFLENFWYELLHVTDRPRGGYTALLGIWLLYYLIRQTIRYAIHIRRAKRETPDGFDHLLTMDSAFDTELHRDANAPVSRIRNAEPPSSSLDHIATILCGARCPKCGTHTSYFQLSGTLPMYGIEGHVRGVRCGTCTTIFRFRQGAVRGLICFLLVLMAFILIDHWVLQFMLQLDATPGGLFLLESGRSSFLVLVLTLPFIIPLAIFLEARIRGIVKVRKMRATNN